MDVAPVQDSKKIMDQKELSFERVKSGIPGFDELVNGGMLRDSVVLLGGDAGTGKTVLSLQFLYRGITDFNENSMFISFAESRESVYRTALAFGWNFQQFETQDKFLFVRYQPKDVMEIVAEGGGTLRDTIEAFNIRRVAIDPITAFALMFESKYKEQQHLNDLFGLLHDLKCTTLVVSEEPARLEGYKTNRAEFLSDGIIHLYSIHKDATRVRAIEIIKMRDTAIRECVCPIKLDKDGLTVLSDQTINV